MLVVYGHSLVSISKEEAGLTSSEVTWTENDVTGSHVDRKCSHRKSHDVTGRKCFFALFGFSGIVGYDQGCSRFLWCFAGGGEALVLFGSAPFFPRAFSDFGVFHFMEWVFGLLLGCDGFRAKPLYKE